MFYKTINKISVRGHYLDLPSSWRVLGIAHLTLKHNIERGVKLQ